VRSFLAATAEDRYGPLWAFAIATGMRQGELLALSGRRSILMAGPSMFATPAPFDA
jgi:hypothetical protein